MERTLHAHGFVIFQVQDDLGLGVVDDAFSEPSFIQVKKVIQVLAGTDSGAAVPPDGLEDLQHKIPGKACARGTGAGQELPAFIYKDGLFLGTVFLCPVPDKIQRHEHPDSQQVAGQRRNVQYGIFIVQGHVGLLVEGAGGAVHQAVQDICQPSGRRRFL